MPQADNDFIPDEWQEDNYPIAHNQEAEQKPGLPPMEHGIPVPGTKVVQPRKPMPEGTEKPGILGKPPSAPEKKPLGPEKLNWEALDLSHGPIKKGLWDNRPQDIRTEIKRGLKNSLGRMLDVGQRGTVARMIDKERHGGLRSGKLRRDMSAAVKRGEFTKLESRKILKKLGAKRSSSIF